MNIIELNSLRLNQSVGATTLLDALKTVELNVTEICNRTCSFCPRGNPQLYSNTKSYMDIELVDLLSKQLADFKYSNRVSLVGFGEPLLYKNLTQALTIIHTNLPNLEWLEVNTNGDFLSKELVQEIADAGCNQLTISMYDSDISETIIDLCKDIDITLTFKHCYENKFEIKLVDRTNILSKDKVLNINSKCNLPFYKMLIDWNGDVIVCANDWERRGKIDNINDASIKDIWLSHKLMSYRQNLIVGNRKDLDPCKYCDIQGSFTGDQSVAIFQNELC